MEFLKAKPLSLVPYVPTRAGFSGTIATTHDKTATHARVVRGNVLFWGHFLDPYHTTLSRYRSYVHRFELIGTSVFAFGFLFFFAYGIVQGGYGDIIFTSVFWFAPQGPAIRILCWLSCLCFGFLWYRMRSEQRIYLHIDDIEQHVDSFESRNMEEESSFIDPSTISKKHHHDVSKAYTSEALIAIERAVHYATTTQHQFVIPEHVFYALLQSETIKSIFLRLGVSVPSMQRFIESMLSHSMKQSMGAPVMSDTTAHVLYRAYEEAYVGKQPYVHVTEVLIAVVAYSDTIQEMMYDLEIDQQKLLNVVEWVRVREQLRHSYQALKRAGKKRSNSGIDRAMTAVATPFLNTMSQDLTLAAKFHHLEPCVARSKELETIFRVIDSGRQSVLITAEHGIGKMSIIEGIAELMIEDRVPKRLQDKRLVQLSISALLSGTTTNGAIERLRHIVYEIRRAKNTVLCINNIHELVSIGSTGGGLDVAESLAELVSSGQVLIIATTSIDGYNKYIANTQMGTVFAKVLLEEMNENQTIQVLQSKAGYTEYTQKVFYSYDALEQSVKLASRFLHDQPLPESAIGIMTEAGSYARRKRGEHQLVIADDVSAVVSQKTGIPTESLTVDESTKLLQLEEQMHTRVIGQQEAVIVVANALRRARADIRSTNRPIANFLFLGPTGVGKTELAKTIASVYFGGEERMIRVDMSEYQDKSAIYRLIGQPGQQGTGILTEAVRQQPFSLVLLDEMEKADPNVLNLFLQVFDDGRLTDSVGRVIDFTNTIIIATSNAGTEYVSTAVQQGKSMDVIRQELIRSELKQYYRPEFLNRFDGIVVFKPLERKDIKQIGALMLKRVAKDLEKRGVVLHIEDAALESLADIGFDPEFGARPMRRAIQDTIENILADYIISGKIKRKDTVVVGQGLSVHIEQA